MLKEIQTILVCPTCKSELRREGTNYECPQSNCAAIYPIVKGIPVLVDPRTSTFDTSYSKERGNYHTSAKSLKRKIRACTPRITKNFAAKKNFDSFRKLLLEEVDQPCVLILGGAEIGAGLKGLLADERLQFLETDIVMGARTELVCDVSHLPFKSQSVDAVIIQAVLEYVLDPIVCVQEIYRVLKRNGIVYSEIPFMQGVHGGCYDFIRLTHLGHQRLFRQFSEIESGACAGPATALGLALQYFFLAFVRSSYLRDAVKLGSALTLFWLKYFDYFLVHTPGGLDAASGTYLLARKSDVVLSDRELITKYRGAVARLEVA